MTENSKPVKPRSYAGKSQGERRSERYEKLIDAGIEMIGVHGYQATSVKAVCTQAELTERYFYESFKNREALLVAIYQHLSEFMKTQMLAALYAAPREPAGIFRALADTYFRTLKADPRVARILFIEAVHLSGTKLMKKIGRDFVEQIRAAAHFYRPDTDLTPERQVLVGSGMFGAFVYIALRWIEDDFRQPVEDVVESTVMIFEAIRKDVW
jgi:AcrR family transcriptional regulator